MSYDDLYETHHDDHGYDDSHEAHYDGHSSSESNDNDHESERYLSGSLRRLTSIRDYDGALHGGISGDDRVEYSYKFQGSADLNGDGILEEIYTNSISGRWATAKRDQITGRIDYEDYGHGGISRVVGIYMDPLVESGVVERGSAFDSQQRFSNDLKIDNLTFRAAGDYDGDGFQEAYWKTNDGTAYLRAIMHADGNIQYANYQNESQLINYLSANNSQSLIDTII